MKIEVKKTIVPSVIKSVLLIIVGLMLTFMADATLVSISYLLGGILCAIGAVAIIQFFKTKENASFLGQFNIVYGVITAIAGVVLIIYPNIVGSLIPICIGIGVIISSAFKIQQALTIKAYDNTTWKVSLVTSFLSLVCGLIILFNPFKTASLVTQMVGIMILIYAVLDLVSTFLLKKTTTTISMEVVEPTSKKERVSKKQVKDAKIVKEVTLLFDKVP